MRLILLIFILFFNIHVSYADNFTSNNYTPKEHKVPGPPGSLEIENVTDISVHVLWSAPVTPANITQYELEAKVLHTYSNDTLYLPKWRFSKTIFRSEINILQPGTQYNLTLKAISDKVIGQEKSLVFNTLIGVPDRPPKELKVLKRDDTTMTVRIEPVESNNGPITYYRLIVMNVDQMQEFQQEVLGSYQQATRDGISYYITADLNPEDIEKDFTIGDGKTYNNYYNAPLMADTHYYAFVGVISELENLTKVRYPDMAIRRFDFQEPSEGAGLVVGLAVAVVIASILLIIGVVVLVLVRHRFHRTRRQRLSDNQELCLQGPMIQVANQGYIPDDEPERVNHYDELKRNVWNIPKDCLQVDTAAAGDAYLGFGLFGHVVRGTIQKPNEKNSQPQHVACYIITDGDLNAQNKRLMLRKLDILIKLGKHENLASLIGTCEYPETVHIVLEYSPLDLKDMLLNHRHVTQNGKFTNIHETEILNILIGIASGMTHLECKNIVHEKLCARHILMFDGRVPKITGHGISHYNRNNIAVDVRRWTAQEVLNMKNATIKSDVWSFGCLLWEICSLGGTPYSHLDSQRFAYEVSRGVRLSKLPYVGEELYQAMINCWQNDPGERPTFHEILQQLIYFRDTLSVYAHLNFDASPDFSFENYVPTMEVAEDVCHRSKLSYS